MLVPSSESDNGLDFIQIDCFGPDRRERQNTVARGGNGGSPGGGGGAGLGGGLYVANDSQNGAAPGNVTLTDVIFNRG